MYTYLIDLIPFGSITEFPDSQRIFGSICWAIRDLYGEDELEALLNNFREHKSSFLVSSSFPQGLVKAPIETWVSNKVKEDIFKDIKNKANSIINLKKFKKIQYITLYILKKYLSGDLDKKEVFESILRSDKKSNYRITNRILHYIDEEIEEVSLHIVKGRRNTINRISNTTSSEDGGNLYYFNRGFLKEGGKLNFFIKTNDIEYFKPLFRYMTDCGLGSDKSIGINNFKVELRREYDFKNNIGKKLLISKYIPFYEEIEWDKSCFKLDFANYKVESRFNCGNESIFKDRIGHLCEGAVLQLKQNKAIYGQLPIVKKMNSRQIRHSGFGFLI